MTDLAKYGPWAVVAGGSEGVGAEFARMLAEDGFNLVLIARKPGPLEETAERCRAIGVQVRAVSVDLVDPGSIAQITEVTADVEVGLLIYNAGANTCSAEFLDAEVDSFNKVIDLNVTRMMELVQHYARPMVARGQGGILLAGSLSGYLGSVRHSVYSGVKAFSRMFAESLWVELRDKGVDVLELVLGVTRTPAMERVGLNFAAPGIVVSEPADVAREGLAHLADGPLWVVSGNEARVETTSGLDRARLVLGSHQAMQRLMGLR